MSEPICPECNGTGEYRGLNVVEPCRACGGKKPKLPVKIIDAIDAGYASVLSQFGIPPQSLPMEIAFPVHSMEQINMDAETRLGPCRRSAEGMECDVAITKVYLTLSDIRQDGERYGEYKNLIQGRTPFTAIIHCGENVHRQEAVTMTACQFSEDGKLADFDLEWMTDA